MAAFGYARCLILAALACVSVGAQVRNNLIEAIPKADDSATGKVCWLELRANGSHRICMQSPTALAASLDWTLPPNNAAGVLTNNGSGVLSWAAGSADEWITATNDSTRTHESSVFSSSAASDRAGFALRRARGSEATPADVNANDRLGVLSFWGYRTGDWRFGAFIDSFAANVGSSTVEGDLRFYVGGRTTFSMQLASNEALILTGGASVGGNLTTGGDILSVGAIEATGAYLQNGSTILNSSGEFAVHWVPSTNNTLDVGSSGKRVRSFLGVSGDLTGNLTAASATFTGAATVTTAVGQDISSGGDVLAAGRLDYGVDFTSGGAPILNASREFATHWIPSVNNTWDLGSSGKRVRKLWVVDMDISGTCTGTACSGGGLFTDAGATTYLTQTGDNLAIGSTSASYKLDVAGAGRFTGEMRADFATFTGSATITTGFGQDIAVGGDVFASGRVDYGSELSAGGVAVLDSARRFKVPLLPATHALYDFGSTGLQWANGYMEGRMYWGHSGSVAGRVSIAAPSIDLRNAFNSVVGTWSSNTGDIDIVGVYRHNGAGGVTLSGGSCASGHLRIFAVSGGIVTSVGCEP